MTDNPDLDFAAIAAGDIPPGLDGATLVPIVDLLDIKARRAAAPTRDEITQKIDAARAAGLGVRQIAQICGITHQQIYRSYTTHGQETTDG